MCWVSLSRTAVPDIFVLLWHPLSKTQLKLRPCSCTVICLVTCFCCALLLVCLVLIMNLAESAIGKCAKKLDDREPFDRFFSEVFRHHSGQDAPGDGERWFFTSSKLFLRVIYLLFLSSFFFSIEITAAAVRVTCYSRMYPGLTHNNDAKYLSACWTTSQQR